MGLFFEPQTTQATNNTPRLDDDHLEEESVINKTRATKEESIKISITLPTNAYFISGIRDFTKTVVQNMTGFSEQWAFRFQSVVDELTNNAIEFGSATGQDVQVTFLSTKGEKIEIFVKDTGTGAAKKSAKEMEKLVENRRKANPATILSIRGRGLAQIVANWTDELNFHDNPEGGLTVHVIKNIEKGEEL